MTTQRMSNSEMFYKRKQIYHRNQRYVDQDAQKIKSQLQIQRRTPQSKSFRSNQKFNTSFTNSTNLFSHKVVKQMNNFKSRLSNSRTKQVNSSSNWYNQSNPQQQLVQQTPVSFKSPNKVKGLSISLGLSRKGIIQQSKQPQDQRLFNNYQLEKHDLSKTTDFSKRTSRNNIFIQTHLNDLTHEYVKPHDTYFYKGTTLKCLFDYKLSKDQGQRVWMTKKRKQDLSATDPNIQAIKQGFQIINPFKSVKISHFFDNSGKELPPQLQMRKMKQNQNYWKNGQSYIRPNIEFNLKQQKNILRQQRLKMIRQKKRGHIQKDKVCMQYFYRHIKKQKD